MEILLVEDNPGDVRLVGELLTEAGAEEFDLTHVERLGEAVQRLREDHFDVVLLDLSLPRSEEHTSELQSRSDLVCRLLLEKKKPNNTCHNTIARSPSNSSVHSSHSNNHLEASMLQY